MRTAQVQPQPRDAQAGAAAATFGGRFLGGVLVKAALLFAILNLLFALLYPMSWLGKISLYNVFFPGRERLPFGENQAQAYNLSLYNLDAMLASLRLNATPKSPDEYRLLVIGDSSVWGTLLRPSQTLTGQVNALHLTCGGKQVQAYNLGYPTLSVTKDLMILQEAVARYQPDRILWMVTLEGLPRETQISSSPILANNAARAVSLIKDYDLQLDPNDPALVYPGFWDKTIVGARRPLADLIRLQFYGVLWGATGIDQTYPTDYEPAARDLAADTSFHGRKGPVLDTHSLALEALPAGMKLAGNVPVTFVNEPILISQGKNSDLRYNFFYPRWAYDQYRAALSSLMQANGWAYMDLWDLVDQKEFTNSAIHLTPVGEGQLAQAVGEGLVEECGK